MPNQKGSLKDRLRSWTLFLNYKLKLKKQEREHKKKIRLQKKQQQILASGKYYSKPKVFGLTILGLFFGLFEIKKKQRLDSLELRINILEKKIEDSSLDSHVIQEIKSIEEDLIVTKNYKNKDNNIIYNCEQKLNSMKAKIKGEHLKQNIKLKNEEDKEKILSTENKNNSKDIKYDHNISNKKGVYIPILEIKVFNKDLKKYNKALIEMNNKIRQADLYDSLYEYEFLVKQLNLKLNELLVKYENLKNIPGFNTLEDMVNVKDIDEFNLRKNNKMIKESIAWCEFTLLSIQNKKDELLYAKDVKEEVKQEKKKEVIKKVEQKEKKLEEKDKNKLSELLLADKIIYDNIVNEKRKIAKFNRLTATMNIKQKKHSIFYYTRNLISSVVNFSLSLFPISIFKNKMLGGLVGGIMLNNSLRSVRKILKPDIEISYIYTNIEKEIISMSNYLNRMSLVCDDSLNQIDDIRNTLYLNYGNDIQYDDSLKGYLDDLSKIENKIRNEQMTILGMNEDLKVVRENNNQKVKKIEGLYN